MRKFKQIKKRVMALALCTVMTLTSNVMVFAEGEVVPAIEESSAPVIEEVATPVVEETQIVSEESSVIVEESTEAVAVAAVEEAVVTTEETTAAVEESSAVVEESSAIVEESSVVIEESSAAVEESSAVVEESSVVVEEPTATTEKSVMTTAETVAATEVKTVETTGAAAGAIEGSVVTTEDTIEIVIQVLEYEDEDVKIHVEEATPEAIPDGASLKVTPITAEDDKEEYAEVEKKLHEKASEEEYEIAGFLAYDITLVDKDGNEVEPDGNVKVMMEYKEAILPATVSEAENLDVTVMHFEEDESGEVNEVVDMVAEENIEAEVKTTEKAEVEKAEFVTDSFSTFTITWTGNNGREVTITVHYVDKAGNDITGSRTNTVQMRSYQSIDLLEYAGNIEGYISPTVRKDTSDGDEIRYIKVENNVLKYSMTNRYNSWTDWETIDEKEAKDIYIVYEKDISITANRVDSDFNSQGTVKLSLEEDVPKTFEAAELNFTAKGYNYTFTNAVVKEGSGASIEIQSIAYREGVYYYTTTAGSEVAFTEETKLYLTYSGGPTKITTVDSKAEHVKISVSDYSIWTQSQKEWNHKVQYDINTGHSLQFVKTGNELSNPDYNVYTGGSTPRQNFINDNLSEGYPKLGNESLAYLFNNGYDANYLFKKVDGYFVYDSDQNFASLNTTTGNFNVYSEPNAGFFPFNSVTEDLKIESASTSTVENHHSGMHVEFTFMQPKSGKTTENADMIFEFSGDDDVWVFIDDVLVLDLGGIHQRSGGTINFATGEVTYTNATNTTIYNRYVEALKEKGLSENEAKEKAKTYFVEYATGKYRFKDYSQHELNFFYLERGAHDSNCMIKYNLLSIPENSVFVEKKITQSNMADFADAEFKFKIEKKDVQNDGTYPAESTVLTNTSYKLYEVDSAGNRTFIETRTTNENGEFILKHRQVAEFSNIKASTKYCVTEIGVTSEVYDNVTLNGSNITIESTKTENGLTKHDYVTGDLLAQEHVYVTFENQCNVSNLRNLIISKKMIEGQTSTESFNIKLEFAEGETWIPYVGDYYLGSSTGEELTTTDGIISLVPGQEVHVIGLISDTQYRVTEVLSEEQSVNYGTPSYSGSGSVETIDGVTYITDTIELSGSPSYIANITNSLLMVVNVEKVWVDSEISHEPVYVGLYKLVGENWVPNSVDSFKVLSEGKWSSSFTGLDGGTYDVRELVPVEGEGAGDFTIGGTQYEATVDYYSHDEYNYKVSYSEPVIVQNTTNITITNARLGEIVIEKVSMSDHALKLQGAEFKLQKLDVSTNKFDDIETGITDKDGNLIFDNLEQGQYKIIEICAPEGYMLSNQEVLVELGGTQGYALTATIENEVLYELPSTGGSGIHLYTIGGTVLMAGAALILYKNKRKEVL